MVSISNLTSAQQAPVLTYVKVQVDGLSCPFCAYGLEKKLIKIKGAKDVLISVDDAYATFNVPKKNQPDNLAVRVDELPERFYRL